MERATFNYIRKVLRDYPHLEKYIAERKQELQNPWKETDLNADVKSNATSDVVGNLIVTIDDDKRIKTLERNLEAINKVLATCDENTLTIAHELYMKRYPQYTIDGLIKNGLIFVSRSKAFELRNKLFEDIAIELGLC
ncbi:transcriptional regulator [Vaginisenegalia massiliensis]|uniref:transcriptional regulator n=1 Tax=Vaginisenegalia massiliensis TaxID=2058294 RepID=UPI000F51FD46|nr:transcriptional regulator [Vaginisenegalia massiliensis]